MNWISDQAPRVARTIRELAAEVNGALPTWEEVQKSAKETWSRMRDLIRRALVPHPEAFAAVMKAFDEELLQYQNGG